MAESISIRGARVNNLKNISLDIPRGKFVVITGISGSGKSSLAFDTLFAEGQRRFAESLSSYARQFLGRMSKPDVDSIEGIPPAIAIEQKVTTRNPRSTVATTTEIYDFLRLVFARIGKTYSPVSGALVHADSVNDVLNYLASLRGSSLSDDSAVAPISPGQALPPRSGGPLPLEPRAASLPKSDNCLRQSSGAELVPPLPGRGRHAPARGEAKTVLPNQTADSATAPISTDQVLPKSDNCLRQSSDIPIYILADINWSSRSDKTELLLKLKEEGYNRLYADGPVRIDEVLRGGVDEVGEAYLLVDRFSDLSDRTRLT